MLSLRTTPNRSTGYTPYFMVYGVEAILPSDILHDAPRVAAYDEDDAEESRRLDVDLLEEEHVFPCQRSTIYQQKLRSYQNRRVRIARLKRGIWCSDLCRRSHTN